MLIAHIALVAASFQMSNVAHRGLWKETGLPQNTVESIKAAYDAGAQVVETDFSLTASGEMICLHDKKALETMSSIVKEPRQITPEDRAVINLGEKMSTPRPYRIPLLSEVLAVVPKDRILQAEIKVYGKTYAKRFDDAVKAAGLVETNIVISGFNEKALADFHRQYPAYRTLWLGCGIVDDRYDLSVVIEKAKEGGFDVICPGCRTAMKVGLGKKDAERIRSAGFEFRLFGVNNREELAYAARLGASGFTCDRFKAAYDWAQSIGGITLVPSRTNGWWRVSSGFFRGVMLPARDPTPDDFRTLREWNVGLVRYQMVRGWKKKDDNQDVDEYKKWLEGRLDVLEKIVLPEARRSSMKVVVDLHVPPGGRSPKGGMNMFEDERFASCFVDCWRTIALRFRGEGDVIYGYDLINEPSRAKGARFGNVELQERAARAIREIDPSVTIIIESEGWAAPNAFKYLYPIDMTNVIYQAHMYKPMEFTHQGIDGRPMGMVYPDRGKGWDEAFIRETLRPIREFQLKYGAKIFIGEFSAAAWAKGGDSYLKDCIHVFGEYGWDWTYHAFREYDGWSIEHESVAGDDRRLSPSGDNPRKRVLLSAFCTGAIGRESDKK